MLTRLQPIEEVKLMARVWFSCIVNLFSLPLLIVRSSTVPATEVLISLLYGGRERDKQNEGEEGENRQRRKTKKTLSET